MSNDSVSTAHYRAVINDLRLKRDELDRMIDNLEAMLELRAPQLREMVGKSPPVFTLRTVKAASKQETTTPTTGNGAGVGDACVSALRERQGETLTTSEITGILVESGFPFTSANPGKNVWSALNNRSKTKRDIRRVGKRWRYVGSDKVTALPAPTDEARLQVNGSTPQHQT